MKYRRGFTTAPGNTEVTESEDLAKKPRGRPCKRRFHVSEFPLRAKGEDGKPKRTPLHIGDPYAHRDSYEVEEVLAQCFKRGLEHFKVILAAMLICFPFQY